MSEAAVNDALNGAAVPGWFGKIPNLGDFVSRRLPDDFVQAWDDWLQGGMAKAQAQLRDAWLARYLVAPVRRFWVGPGVLGDDAWAGVMMPSVDGVGRHFPLTIATPMKASPRSLAATLAAHAWFHAIEAAARRVLDVHFSADDLESALAQVDPLNRAAERDLGASVGPVGRAGDEPSQLADALLGPFRRARTAPQAESLKPCSVWWCGDAAPATEFDRYASLPPATAFAALLVEPAERASAANAP
jgi:type VI secretion system protein ImpM